MTQRLKVAHLTPTFFHPKSIVGGGDRYPLEVAAAQRALGIDAQVFTYGSTREELDYKGAPIHVSPTRRRIRANAVNPVGDAWWRAVRWADVVHVYQEHTLGSDAAVLASRLMRRRVFVTDLGGSGVALSNRVPLGGLVTGFLPISDYAARSHAAWAGKTTNIGAGVDLQVAMSLAPPTRDFVLFVGRIMPHKGIDYLIEGLPERVKLLVVGEPYGQEYFEFLRSLAQGRDVEFRSGVGDDELRALYRNALVTVLSTVSTDRWGATNTRAQLSALTVLESFAAGTPAIATNVEAVPEILEDGKTGFLVPPNDAAAIHAAITRLRGDPALVEAQGRAGRALVEREYTWRRVAQRCVGAYLNAPG